MTNVKVLMDKRGPLQGTTVDQVVRQAYGPEASLEADPEGNFLYLVKREGDTVDAVINVQGATSPDAITVQD